MKNCLVQTASSYTASFTNYTTQKACILTDPLIYVAFIQLIYESGKPCLKPVRALAKELGLQRRA